MDHSEQSAWQQPPPPPKQKSMLGVKLAAVLFAALCIALAIVGMIVGRDFTLALLLGVAILFGVPLLLAIVLLPVSLVVWINSGKQAIRGVAQTITFWFLVLIDLGVALAIAALAIKPYF